MEKANFGVYYMQKQCHSDKVISIGTLAQTYISEARFTLGLTKPWLSGEGRSP